jgi:hypothetical protein
MNDNMFTIDYYSTKRSELGYEYDIVDKFKIRAYSSDGTLLGDDIDVFLYKKDFPSKITPTEHDLIFFLDRKKFFQVKRFESDGGDFFIVGVNPL